MSGAFDPTKPVRTRDGRPARIVCSDVKSERGYTVVAVITDDDGYEITDTYQANGYAFSHGQQRDHDLVNVPELVPLGDMLVGQRGIVRAHGDGTVSDDTWVGAEVMAIYDTGHGVIGVTLERNAAGYPAKGTTWSHSDGALVEVLQP